MKFANTKTAGNAIPSANSIIIRIHTLLTGAFLLACGGLGTAQEMYKYRGADGEWIYTDRRPADSQPVEVRALPQGDAGATVSVSHRFDNGQFVFVAQNDFHAPVEVILALDILNNLEVPPPEQRLRWVVQPKARQTLMQLAVIDVGIPTSAEYRYLWLPGDPATEHSPTEPYRAPFAVATEFEISQAFPTGITHQTPDSYYAIDVAMPIGTDVYAARGGIVFDVASTNFRGGQDPNRDLAAANLIRILHDDGTHAVYAHLNWNSIRVRPGDRVARGEYIADSGNTGFTTGPHLHFAVIRNRGMRLESVPVTFEGPDGSEIVPATGDDLVAY